MTQLILHSDGTQEVVEVEDYEPAPKEPTELEQLRADIDYIAMVQGVEL